LVKDPFQNIIFITLDGYRADKLSLCPILKSYVDKSISFSNMITVAPYTLAAHHAIFSGMYASRNGVNAYYNMFKFKKNEITTLPEILQKQGYYTSCDIINDIVIPTKGFDEVNIFDEKTVDFKKRHREIIHEFAKKEKFFLFLHYTEPHKNYVVDVVQKFKDKENKDEYFNAKKQNEERYDSYMYQLDEYVSEILDEIKVSGLTENTTIIFQADHGTGIGERNGEMFYGVFVYDYTTKVFSMIHIPGKDGKIIKTQCPTIDLFSTIVEMSGYPINKLDSKVQSSSLFPILDGFDSKNRDAFIETGGLYGPWPSPKKHNVFAVRSNNKKLIYNDTPETWEFYNLTDDPMEQINIYDEKSNEIQELKTKLFVFMKENNIDTKLSNYYA
jgi:arylsulfatase A-like enzyme